MPKARSKCGIFGIWENYDIEDDSDGMYSPYLDRKTNVDNFNYTNVLQVLYGLKCLQHRGRESCGLSYVNDTGERVIVEKRHGLVSELINSVPSPWCDSTPSPLDWIYSHGVSGHVRYSTSGSKCDMKVVQPLSSRDGTFSLAHNGNIPNLEVLKEKLSKDISLKFKCPSIQDYNDTNILILILELKGIEPGIQYILENIPGAYSLIILTTEAMYLVRDPLGFKPLCFLRADTSMGIYDKPIETRPRDYKWYASSESSAISNCSFKGFPHDVSDIVNVPPGTAYRFDKHGERVIYHKESPRKSPCSFEYLYFMYYKTYSDSLYVNDIRNEIGKQLFLNETITFSKDTTIVVGSPNSGISYAKAYSRVSGIPYVQEALRKEKKERTFILPSNGERINKIKKIMIADPKLLNRKNVILIDDSIVRGNTIRHVIKLLRNNGAASVHVRVAFPKIISPCYYGIDFPTYEELIGHKHTVEEIGTIIGSDSIGYTSVETLVNVLSDSGEVCVSCLTDSHAISKYDW